MPEPRKKARSDEWVSLLEASRTLGESRLSILTRAIKGEVEAKYVAGRTVVSRASIARLKPDEAVA